MPRSVPAALLLVAALAAPASIRAAEPDVEPYLEAAEAAGLPCSPFDHGAGGMSWSCDEPAADPGARSFFATVDDRAGDQFAVSVYRGWPDPRPAEPDVLALMDRFIVLTLGDDTAARDWLHQMHDERRSIESLQRGDWHLDWYATWETPGEGVQAEVQLHISFSPELANASPTPPPIAPVACLEADVIRAIEQLDTATVAADPSPDEVADALDELTLDGTADVARDRLVQNLRVPPEDEVDLVLAAQVFQSEVAMQACGPGSPSGDLAAYLAEYGLTCTDVGGGTECTQEVTDDQGLDAVYSVTTQTDADGELISIDAVVTSLDVSMPSDAGMFLRGIAERAPVDDPADLIAWWETAVSDEDGGPYESGEWAAAWSDTVLGEGRVWALSIVRPEAVAPPAPTDEAGPTGPAPGPVGPADRPFAESVPAPAEVSADPVVVLQSAALAALLVFLMPFPSQLFNSTLEEHEDEVRRWFRLDRIGATVGRIGAFWASWPGVALFTLLAALLYGFLDPGFGLDIGSLATFLGMLLGIVLVTAAFAVPALLAHRRHGDRPSLKVVPVSLLIGVVCVLLSRLTNFQPGYLYGLLIGLAFARELSQAEEGRATAIGALLMLAVAFASWLGLGALPEGDAFGLVVVRTSLAALMVAGLEGVVFGLLPMRFLPGEPLYAWNRVLWGGLLLIGAFAFFHILINPASGYLSDTSRTPLFTVVALLVGFSLVSVAFWAWFRIRGVQPPEERTVT